MKNQEMKLYGRILQHAKNAAVKCHYPIIHGWIDIFDDDSFNDSLTFWVVENCLENVVFKM